MFKKNSDIDIPNKISPGGFLMPGYLMKVTIIISVENIVIGQIAIYIYLSIL